MPRRKTTEEFVRDAKSKHGDKYDYSQVEYVNNHTEVRIICPVHEPFYQIPLSHLSGSGCPKCANETKSKDTEQFILDARAKHGDKYDYSETEYVNARTKVRIICFEHGGFYQNPSVHLSGSGCPKCATDARRNDTEQFIKDAKKIHGDKYDYSEVEYVNRRTKVRIICPVHGPFFQTSNAHINMGCGCPRCFSTAKKDIKQFLKDAKKVHGDKYDYSEAEYVNKRTKVRIICPEHGLFLQTPDVHINYGCGCPKCNNSKGEELVSKILEENNIEYISQKRISFDESFGYFDFSIDSGFIEFDGKQHFKPIEHFGGVEALKVDIKRDTRKNDYCRENKIPLLRIRYDQKDIVDDIVKDFLERPEFYLERYNPYLTDEEYYEGREKWF